MATPSDVAPRTSPRRSARRMVFALAAVAGVLLSSAPAQANPGAPTTTAEAAELVAARGHELEVISERYNEARETLEAQIATAKAAAGTLEKATAELAAAQQHVRGIARAAYTGESVGSLRALMTSDSADAFVSRVSTLQTIAGHQNAVLGRAAEANVAAAQAQATASASAAEAQKTFDAVAAEQAELEAKVAEYRAIFDRLSAQDQQAAVAAASHEDRASRDAERSEAPVETGPVVASSQAAQVAVDTALAQRGKPYLWAADGPGSFDCSGLVQYAYAAAGIDLPHSSRMQAGLGRSVSRSELQPGDLVAFYSPISHIGIYIGNGQMVHAPSSGDVVKISSIDRMGGSPSAMTRIAG